MYIRFFNYFLNFNLVKKKNKRSFGEGLIKARSVMYAKQRRGRLAGGGGVGVSVCVVVVEVRMFQNASLVRVLRKRLSYSCICNCTSSLP